MASSNDEGVVFLYVGVPAAALPWGRPEATRPERRGAAAAFGVTARVVVVMSSRGNSGAAADMRPRPLPGRRIAPAVGDSDTAAAR